MLQTVRQSLLYNEIGFVHQRFRFLHIDKSAAFNFRSRCKIVRSALHGKRHNDNAVLCQMLTVTQNRIADISDAKSIHEDRSHRNCTGYLCRILIQLQNISGMQNENIFLRDAKSRCYLGLCNQVAVLAVHRNGILRLNQ